MHSTSDHFAPFQAGVEPHGDPLVSSEMHPLDSICIQDSVLLALDVINFIFRCCISALPCPLLAHFFLEVSATDSHVRFSDLQRFCPSIIVFSHLNALYIFIYI